ncbi:phosphate ABC transporter substrate-binding protein PstS [Kineococcus rubinsiae]|uniref:phosphate ABC transporter substrate-binding protein PstS n=1 Tax=Kineococcus rubinsiae TaxID=2609562 RepID=UPI00142F971A|nr:phosphate ABC transporter substrate-binding protein PstS [Kineococcus rubinsiae]NIZ89616.1 phosphate ABC transporter substrate-binding protein PstS [Kineococcus rubinsiae]
MTFWKTSRLLTIAAVGALALTGCGSDDNTSTAAPGGAAASSSTAAADCGTGTLNGEGSSAQKNAMDQVSQTGYLAQCPDATINYNATGSGAGRKQFTGGQVDWAGSDSALKPEEATAAATRCMGNPAWNLPMVAGPIAIAYKLDGVTDLTLNAEVAAKIFQGQITTWNDPAIAALNSGVTLPATPISVFFRTGTSGTTENFTKYLHATAPDAWTADGSGDWAGKGEGREGSAGVAQAVAGASGGITYVEWSFAQDNKLNVAKVDNGAGAVELTGESAGKTIATATQVGTGNDLALKIDYTTKEAGAYPIVLVTYEIVCSKGLDADKTKLLKSFLTYFSDPATQTGLQDIGYAPLPAEVSTKVKTAIAAIS